ncbi:MAG: MarR family transcriptional regulator [Nitrososphaerota archaeon]|nr:MarR family transcriptional regulator [Nitrososphaerota archaeon]
MSSRASLSKHYGRGVLKDSTVIMKHASSSLEKSHNTVWQAVADANKLWYRLAEKQLSTLEITPSEFRVLRLLSERGTCPMVKLARDQLMTPGGMTGLIDHLEDLGLIQRIRSRDDRRIINIEITKKGGSIVEKGKETYRRFLEKSLKDLSEQEIDSFLRILNKMISSVQKHEQATNPG